MAFPASPSVGDLYTTPSGTEYIYTSQGTWRLNVDAASNSITYQGDWDASAGSFPATSASSIGHTYKVSVGGTVDGVTFAVGDTITAEINSGSTATYAGNWYKVNNAEIPGVVTHNADISLLTDPISGIYQGNWDRDVGAAASVADITNAQANKVGVTAASLRQLLTNRSASGDLNDGLMNSNGRLGFAYSLTGSAVTASNFNAVLTLDNADTATLAVPDGVYVGQVLAISFGGGAGSITTNEMTGIFRGSLRDHATNFIGQDGSKTSIGVRPGEGYSFVWTGAAWACVGATFNMFSGTGWHENQNGTITIEPTATPINPASYPAFATFPPVTMQGANGFDMAIGGQV